MRHLLLHALHLLVPAALFLFGAPWLASIGIFLGAFALFHDTAHANLGLPRKMNEAILTITGALLGISGHAGRRSHLFHHAHPGCPDDMEGRDVDSPWFLALLRAPFTIFALIKKSWRSTEWLLVIAVMLVAPREYVLVMLLGQATMPLWAARLSHRPPAWMMRIAEPMARAGITLATLFVTHEAHHARPWIPTFDLNAADAATAQRAR